MTRAAIDVVRQLSRPEHDRLERSLSSFGWLEDRARYAAALERFAGLHAVLDDVVVASAGELEGLDVGRRLKLPLLRADLAALGVSADRVAAVPRPAATWRSGKAAALGVLYVTEGATLGGKLIRRQVRRQLGEHAPTAFFGAYDRDAARSWRELVAYLNAAASADADAEAIAFAALETMRVYGAWLAPLIAHG